MLLRLAGIVLASVLLLSFASQGISSPSSSSDVGQNTTPSGTQPQRRGAGAGELALIRLTDAEIMASNRSGLEDLLEISDRLFGRGGPDGNDDGPGPSAETDPFAPPEWLGEILLEDRERDGGPFIPTPEELVDRQIRTVDVLPPPADGEFEFTIDEVPEDVVERSTWRSECPVPLEDLRYLTLSHIGFDLEAHTGELIIHKDSALGIAAVFSKMFDIGYPIEEMRVVGFELVDSEPTGDQNITTGFVCRASTAGSHWSEHAFGTAIDINPFQNPYVKGSLIIPQLSEAYLDRDFERPGMIEDTGAVVAAFDDLGWDWGGNWSSALDFMHFSLSGN